MPPFATPAAADENLKQVVEKIASAYADNFNKQNPTGIAALYANGAVLIGAAGPRADIAKYYEGAFKAGLDHEEITVDQAQPLGADALISTGEYHITGKSSSGAPIDIKGFWTGVDVREGGVWKIRMLAGIPKAPPPKD